MDVPTKCPEWRQLWDHLSGKNRKKGLRDDKRELIRDLAGRRERCQARLWTFYGAEERKEKKSAAFLRYAIGNNTVVNRAPSGPDDLAGRILRCRFSNILRPNLPPAGSRRREAQPSSTCFLLFQYSPFALSTHSNGNTIGIRSGCRYRSPRSRLHVKSLNSHRRWKSRFREISRRSFFFSVLLIAKRVSI